MLFNSYGFIFIFLPVVLLLYWAARTTDQKKVISVAASYAFYGVWSVKFAALMLLTTSSDYFFARLIASSTAAASATAAARQRRRKVWLVLSLGLNLGVLAVFKYYDFFAGSLNALFAGLAHAALPAAAAPSAAGLSPAAPPAQPLLPLLRLALPIGISFYTFESMSYVIDVYREKVQAARRFLDYAHFVTMFPRLVAGPIARYTDVVAQLRALPPRLGWDRAAEAIHFFTLGLAKKMLVADPLAVHLVDPLFKSPGSLNFFTGWLAALGYTVQIYMDFSGYSDMAVGLGLLLGFRLPRNFHLPYTAAGVAEFWRRWHITLSNWLRDYLFIPLGGSRAAPWRTSLNYFVTMLLGGLWHGANWTFVLWGAYQGAGLALSHRLDGTATVSRIPRLIRVAATFLFTVVGWVIFRSPSVRAALSMFKGMLGLRGLGLSPAGGAAAAGAAGHAGLGLGFGLDLGVGLSTSAGALTLVTLAVGLLIGFTVDTWELWAAKEKPGGGGSPVSDPAVSGAQARPHALGLAFPPRSFPLALAYGLLLVICVAQLAAPSPFIYFQF